MSAQTAAPLLEALLEKYRSVLGDDFTAYSNHCHRVFNFAVALTGADGVMTEKIAIALAFHDLGIWTHKTIDYLAPSARLAVEYLQQSGSGEWAEEIAAMIEEHHKISRYKDPVRTDGLVEFFRQADLIDVSFGAVTFGLPRSFIRKVKAAFPNAGFHKRLVALTMQRMKKHPLSPLPMMKL